ncbi:uncharacterized protein SPPG_00745 [Spizellomyces punctatus DAOM BR117]|uniref:Origin recognition complex subunit 3 n=1 Tax=Spizellomyces punctatus (strain DAOM BR117) TaxID=645134 RepID=A0A0L0HW08_SPIPD|nr:uncharacterized protein SPPG_00745 [Spizellomyces punctatus DAOM BR117]KND05070.1 hypothetical protein SPPG_00745 [Spizellomyces punctatus DAOM BR117]|eukprot:XP_016613109.1 hypothetical protein SPPG_00745 [Spizellomyces punctatus DAOM BR117]
MTIHQANTALFESVSEGTFLVLPKTTRASSTPSVKRSKQKSPKNDSLLRECEGFQRLYGGQEPEALCRQRFRCYKQRWRAIEETINRVLVKHNSQAIDNIVDFVNNAYASIQCSAQSLVLPFREVPTGLIFAGINIPDQELLFSHVTAKLTQNTCHSVAILPSRECLTLKTTVKSMIEQFLDMRPTVAEDQMENNNQNGNLSSYQPRIKAPNYDMQILADWHRERNSRGHLVAIIPDFECFDPIVIQDLINICSEYQGTLPFVFIFGVATSIEALHQSLPRAVLSLLRMEKFKLQHSNDCINAIVEELLLKPEIESHEGCVGLKLALEPYELLINSYQLHTLSVGGFVRALKYAVMDYYYSNPLSILWDMYAADRNDQMQDILEPEHIIDIRLLKSFKRYIEAHAKTHPDHVARLLLNDTVVKAWLSECFQRIVRYQIRYHAALCCVLELQKALNSPSFSRSKRVLHMMALQGGFVETEYMSAIMLLLRKRSILETRQYLEGCLAALQQTNSSSDACRLECAAIQKLMEDLNEFVDSDPDSSESDEADSYTLKHERKRALSLASGSRTTNVSKRLKPIVEHVKEGTTQAFLKRVSDFLKEFLSDATKCYKNLPLHEVVYYSNAARLKKAFHPQPRAVIQTALGQTRHYLKCDCCPTTTKGDDTISHTLQDSSIAYRLYLECGRMINLYDWFVAFGAIVEKETEGSSLDRTDIQARFIKSIAELQFLGFIKPTTRKTDHAVRLTWGTV